MCETELSKQPIKLDLKDQSLELDTGRLIGFKLENWYPARLSITVPPPYESNKAKLDVKIVQQAESTLQTSTYQTQIGAKSPMRSSVAFNSQAGNMYNSAWDTTPEAYTPSSALKNMYENDVLEYLRQSRINAELKLQEYKNRAASPFKTLLPIIPETRTVEVKKEFGNLLESSSNNHNSFIEVQSVQGEENRNHQDLNFHELELRKVELPETEEKQRPSQDEIRANRDVSPNVSKKLELRRNQVKAESLKTEEAEDKENQKPLLKKDHPNYPRELPPHAPSSNASFSKLKKTPLIAHPSIKPM